MRYGDCVWLQIGRREVLGTSIVLHNLQVLLYDDVCRHKNRRLVLRFPQNNSFSLKRDAFKFSRRPVKDGHRIQMFSSLHNEASLCHGAPCTQSLQSQWEVVNKSLMKGDPPDVAWRALPPSPSKRAAAHALDAAVARFGGAAAGHSTVTRSFEAHS